MLFRSENPILGPDTQVIWNDGTLHYLAGDSAVNLVGTALTNPRGIDSEPTLPANALAVTGSASAIRGNLTVPASGSVSSGYLYGTQGKLTVKGTLTTANFSAGLVGQLDLSAATLTSPGPISAIWGDMGASMSASAISGAAGLSILHLTNTALGATINSAIFVEALSTYLLDVSNASYSPFFHVGAPTTLSGSLKIKTSAGDRYIALYTTQ
jgi:hypothetical protein